MILSSAWYRSAVALAAVAVFFSNFSDYGQRYGVNALLWIFLFTGLTAPLVIPALFAQRVTVTPLVGWMAVYLLVSIAWYPRSSQTGVSYQDMQTRLLSMIFLGLMLFLFSRPREQYLARIAVAGCVLLSVALNLVDLFRPLTFSKVPGRSSGLFLNVNQSGAALVLGMIVAYEIVPNRLKIPFVAATAIGIITTFSRAAILSWVLVVLYLGFRAGINLAQFRRLLVLCLVVVAFFASPYWSGMEHSLRERGALNLDVMQRINFLSSGNTGDASARERESVATIAWRRFTNRPLLGYGTGDNRQTEGALVGYHNMYLAMMVDHGILGLFFLPALILAAIWGYGRAQRDVALPFAMFLGFWGFFSHNIFEERYILLAVALVGAMVASARSERRAAAPEPAPPPSLGALGVPA